MVAVVELTEGPGIRASYARAALGLLPGTPRSGTLPDVELRQRATVTDLAHLAAYDRVCGFRFGDTLPATYPHVLAFPLAMRLMTAPDFPLPLLGLVHVTNRITVSGPLAAAAPLDLSVRAANLRDHPRGRRFDVIATGSVDGAEVWRGVSTYLKIAAPPRPTGGSPVADGSLVAGGTVVADGSVVAGGFPVADGSLPTDGSPRAGGSVLAGGSLLAGDGLLAGMPEAAGGALWRVPGRMGGDYAAVSGDRNPIHTSWVGARLSGFPGPIAHGMWTKARALAALEGRLPDRFTVEVAFKKPIPLPSKVRFRSVPDGPDRHFTVSSHRLHLTGTITPPA